MTEANSKSKSDYNVFIRGIYSTALTKLFKDAGYKIIFPSTTIQKRFPDIEEFSGSYSKDIIINDRYDKEGISITVKNEIWEKVKDDFPINANLFPHIIKLDAKFPLNSIHKGIVIQSNKTKNYSIVRLYPDTESERNQFHTTLGRVNRSIKVGTDDIFQVVFEDVGRNYAYLNRGYTISGDLAVIMPRNKRAFISKKIKDKDQRKKLNGVIEKLGTSEFGILLRTASQYATEIEILREIQKLREKYLEVEAKINQSDTTIGFIQSENISFNYIFPSLTKQALDKVRAEVIPTVKYHHEIRAGLSISSKLQLKILNLSELIMEELTENGYYPKINESFESFYYTNLYRPKQYLNIKHNKLNGRTLNLKPGIIKKIERLRTEDSDNLKIILRRRLSGRGVYDGLDIPIEEGDYAIGVYETKNWYYETIYYSAENELKGRYFNINTPITLRPDSVYYYDLEIDVIEPLNRQRKIVDLELLEEALSMGIVTKKLYDKALEVAKRIESGEVLSELDKLSGRRRKVRSIESEEDEDVEPEETNDLFDEEDDDQSEDEYDDDIEEDNND